MNVQELAIRLSEAQQDFTLYQRLQTAEQRVKEAQVAYDVGKAADDVAAADEEKRKYEAQFAGISAIRIAEVPSAAHDEGTNLLSRTFDITYTRLQFDGYANRSLPKAQTVRGFTALPFEVLLYLGTPPVGTALSDRRPSLKLHS